MWTLSWSAVRCALGNIPGKQPGEEKVCEFTERKETINSGRVAGLKVVLE